MIEYFIYLPTLPIVCFEQDQVVCPPKLWNNLFTTAAVDNIDHNPSSTTATDSFHGTGISLFQHSVAYNEGVSRDIVAIETTTSSKAVDSLPQSFTTIPLLVLLISTPEVPRQDGELMGSGLFLPNGFQGEREWLENVFEKLNQGELQNNEYISWAAYHASMQNELPQNVCLSAILPLFKEQAHSPAMIRHSMIVVRDAVQFLNPGQIPVVTFDQPLYDIAKQVQWNWPDMFEEDQFVVMLGGLHIETASFKALGNWLDGSGWTDVLVQAEVAKSGTADSFLKASHITRTRHAHQVTAAICSYYRNRHMMHMLKQLLLHHWNLMLGVCSNSMLFPSLSTGVSRLNLS